MIKTFKKTLKYINKYSLDEPVSREELKYYKLYDNVIIGDLLSQDLIRSKEQMINFKNVYFKGIVYYPTYKGKTFLKEYKKNLILKILCSLLNGIIFPIIVAYITTLITLSLKS